MQQQLAIVFYTLIRQSSYVWNSTHGTQIQINALNHYVWIDSNLKADSQLHQTWTIHTIDAYMWRVHIFCIVVPVFLCFLVVLTIILNAVWEPIVTARLACPWTVGNKAIHMIGDGWLRKKVTSDLIIISFVWVSIAV